MTRTRTQKILKALLLLYVIMWTSLLSQAQDSGTRQGLMNKLLAPGPLSEAHKDLEELGCLDCHSPQQGVPNDKCLACHKEIRPSVELKTGFHGLTTKNCMECHSEHKGRAYDSTLIDEKTFDHKATGYPLDGKHAAIKCVECHLEKRKSAKKTLRPEGIRYLGLKSTCVACHKKDDVHKFKAPFAQKDCNACHGLNTWKSEIRFDHEKDARYKLVEKHATIKCASCHINKATGAAIYKWPKLKENKCLSCHTNAHKGNLSKKFAGGKCNTCHSQTKWQIPKFNHSLTGFPLREKHAEAKCVDCHKQPTPTEPKDTKHFNWKGLRKDCLACHKDFHRFDPRKQIKKIGFANQCLNCHNEGSWTEGIRGFDHNKTTRFSIEGKHIGLDCIKCHVPTRGKGSVQKYEFKDLNVKTCEVCHKSPHKNQSSKEFLRKCSECHNAESWKTFKKNTTQFNHDKATRFPLTGKHATISCNKCHVRGKQQIFKFAGAEKQFCVSCHTDVHRGQFSKSQNDKACSTCHTTQSFKELLAFNHDKNTRFKITGKHKGLKCVECHKPTDEFFPGKEFKRKGNFEFEGTPQTGFCSSCHADVHKGQFASEAKRKMCAECHVTDSFSKLLPFDHNKTSFPLRDKHLQVKCSKCHIVTNKKFPPPSKDFKNKFHFPEIASKDCKSCHKDVHKGTLGAQCSQCHVEKGWKITRDFHKNFSLKGVHFSLDCVECHQGNRKLSGQSQNCALCHQKDDIHKGALPACGDCHQQQFWEVLKFKHSMTAFPLRGVHRTLDCFECHKGGVYKGLQNRCIDCHAADADAVGSPIHNMPTFQSCNECHNQFSF